MRFRKAVDEIFPTPSCSGPTLVLVWSNRSLKLGAGGGCYLASPIVAVVAAAAQCDGGGDDKLCCLGLMPVPTFRHVNSANGRRVVSWGLAPRPIRLLCVRGLLLPRLPMLLVWHFPPPTYFVTGAMLPAPGGAGAAGVRVRYPFPPRVREILCAGSTQGSRRHP